MTLILTRAGTSETAALTLPPEDPEEFSKAYARLDALSPMGTTRLWDVQSPVPNLRQYIGAADYDNRADLQKLNYLAGMIDGMGEREHHILAGMLDARSINGLDDVIQAAQSVADYTILEGVTSDLELGGYLVEHGYLDCPDEVKRHLDYRGIGIEFSAEHGGAYRPEGYVLQKSELPPCVREQSAAQCGPDVSDVLISLDVDERGRRFTLSLPADEEYLDDVADHLGIADFTEARITACRFLDLELASLVPQESAFVEGYNELAWIIEEMKRTDGELKKYCAVLTVEQPESFPAALYLAQRIDDYELVSASPEEYGKDYLESIGMDLEMLNTLDGYTDFAALGKAMMEEDGVRRTEYGLIRRFSSPFPEESQTQWQQLT